MLPYKESLIIIPTYNEILNVEKMIHTLFQLYPEISILIIDDGSPDGTAAKVKEMQTTFSTLNLIERSGKLGLGTAYTTGFKWALQNDFNYIFEMDCDFSHDPQEIPNFLEAAKSNDLVIGSRYINGIRIINWPMKRLLMSYFASKYIKIITSMPILDATGGFKCFTRKALETINLDKINLIGYGFQVELNFKVWSQNLKYKEIPITFYERQEGYSKMSGGIFFEAFFGVIMLRMRRVFGLLN